MVRYRRVSEIVVKRIPLLRKRRRVFSPVDANAAVLPGATKKITIIKISYLLFIHSSSWLSICIKRIKNDFAFAKVNIFRSRRLIHQC